MTYAEEAKAKLAQRKREDRKAFVNDVIARVIIGGICAAIAYAVFPGGQVLDKGLAALTLGDICALVTSGLFALAAFKQLNGD